MKEVGNLFLCQKCIQRADQAPCYSGMDVARKNTSFPEEYEEDLEEVCVEECGEFRDYGYTPENDEDYDSDIFMRQDPQNEKE